MCSPILGKGGFPPFFKSLPQGGVFPRTPRFLSSKSTDSGPQFIAAEAAAVVQPRPRAALIASTSSRTSRPPADSGLGTCINLIPCMCGCGARRAPDSPRSHSCTLRASRSPNCFMALPSILAAFTFRLSLIPSRSPLLHLSPPAPCRPGPVQHAQGRSCSPAHTGSGYHSPCTRKACGAFPTTDSR